jgi:hypothetical protein
VKRKARGFRPVKNLIPMLYFTAGKLPLSAALDFYKPLKVAKNL